MSRFTPRLGGIALVAGLAACPRADDDEIVVFAAASLSESFRAVGPAFEASNPGASVRFNFAGSQVLASQLLEGASADVVASANAVQMQRVIAAGRVARAEPFTSNRLVIATPADNPQQIKALDDLARPGVRVVLAGEAVPAGSYARQALDQVDYGDAVLANLVSNEDNVRGVVAKLQMGEVDAGIVYASDVEEADLHMIELPPDARIRAIYEIAVIRDAHAPKLAEAFVTYVAGEEASGVLADHGFGAL